MPPIGAGMPKALPEDGDAKKADAKAEESKLEDKTPPALIEPITPAGAAAPEAKPEQTLPPAMLPSPAHNIPKPDDSNRSLPVPPLPPPPKE